VLRTTLATTPHTHPLPSGLLSQKKNTLRGHPWSPDSRMHPCSHSAFATQLSWHRACHSEQTKSRVPWIGRRSFRSERQYRWACHLAQPLVPGGEVRPINYIKTMFIIYEFMFQFIFKAKRTPTQTNIPRCCLSDYMIKIHYTTPHLHDRCIASKVDIDISIISSIRFMLNLSVTCILRPYLHMLGSPK
jgi:hypothetical protein